MKKENTKTVVRLCGGIGNQLFQYSAGRALSQKNGAELLLDTSLLYRRRYGLTPRRYEISSFCIKARKLNLMELAVISLRVRRPLRYFFDKELLYNKYIYYKEPSYRYDSKMLEIKGNTILEGYWQSPYYFNEIADELRREIRLKLPLSKEFTCLLGNIKKNNTVSLHIRRGDYVSCPKIEAEYVSLNEEYYKRAIEKICEYIKQPTVFMFSDDPEYAEYLIQTEHPKINVSKAIGLKGYEELVLMSMCAHHIIANSSFSWWGAWLDSRPEKIVIAPQKWFKSGKDIRDLLPPEWHTV